MAELSSFQKNKKFISTVACNQKQCQHFTSPGSGSWSAQKKLAAFL